MNTHLLEIFLASADAGSFTKAAEALSLTSSNVMRQINLLEEEIGVPLLVRSTKGVELTNAGKVFYSESQNLLRMSLAAAARTRRASETSKKNVRLGISALNPMREFNRIWRRVPRRREFALSLINLPTSVNGVVSPEIGDFRETDAVFCSGPVIDHFTKVSFLPLWKYPLTCAVPLSHPLAQKKQLFLSDLCGETILFPARGSAALCQEIVHYITDRNLGIKLETPSIFFDQEVFNYCAAHDLPIISLSCWNDIHPGLINLPVRWERDWSIPYGLIWRNDGSGAARDFIAALQDVSVGTVNGDGSL